MKILNFGSCNIDHVYSMDHIVAPGETETTTKLEIFPGGKGLNQSIAAARAGAVVYHAGCLGAGGELLENILRENGVDLSYIRHVDEQNGHAVIQVAKDGENSIFLFPGSNEMITESQIDDTLSDFSEGDLLILQNETNNLKLIIEKAYAKKMTVLLNPAPFNEKITELDFSMVSYLILNETEAAGLTGSFCPEESLEVLGEKYPHLKVVLTLGSEGCIYMEKGEKTYRSAFKVTAVDTTAAGDTFTGYFAAGLTVNKEIPEILKNASAAAALTVSKMGAAPSIPTAKETKDFLGE